MGKVFIVFFWKPIGSRVNIDTCFPSSYTLRCKQSDKVLIICHRYQQHQRYHLQNLPPVSTTPVTSVFDTGGKFSASVVDTGVANLPLLSLILVVHLGLKNSN
jgi:hypothetical protein